MASNRTGAAAVALVALAGAFVGATTASCGGKTVVQPAAGGGGTGTGGSGTGGTGTGGSGTTSSSGTGGSISCPVAYTNASGPCDLLDQDCPPGQWCDVDPSGPTTATQCVPSEGGTKGQGQPCYATSECQDGLPCIAGHCSAYCCPSNDEPCQDGTCAAEVAFPDDGFAFVCVYSANCLFQQACEPGYGCYVVDVDQGITQCAPASGANAGEGDPCLFLNDCGDSQQCYSDPPGDGTCRGLCDTTSWQGLPPGLGGCLPGRVCVALSWPGLPHVGICLPP